MISSFRSRMAARSERKIKKGSKPVGVEVDMVIPEHFRCPISLDLMKDPVTLSTGITYDRESVEKWMYEDGKRTCPVTGMASLEPVPNHTIRKMIQDWCVANKSYGIDRIPTPRVPATSYQVSEMLSKMEVMRGKGDGEGVVELAAKIKALAKESERNKRCIVVNGSGRVLSETFESFSLTENVAVLEEILSCLTVMLPFDQETRSFLGSTRSLRSMVWILTKGGLSGRRNAVLTLQEILSFDHQKLRHFVEIENGTEALVKLIKEPICPTTTNASLLTIYHLVNPSTSLDQKNTLIARFLDMGLMEKLLEMLVDCQRSVCEKALGVFDGLCVFDEGLEKAHNNALTVPVLVKKLLRVSDMATEFSVSILWRLSKYEKKGGEGSVVVEALEVGAFQKLLLLLQVGSSVKTKEKAGELLKLLNLHRGRVECIESMDFKNLKRSF